MLFAIRSRFIDRSFACLALAALPAAAQPTQINGQPIVVLKRAATSNGARPEFLSATILPGRGMNLLQVTANLPGKGIIEVLATPSLDEVAKALDGDAFGNKSFSTFGGAYLVPYANRIRGTLPADGPVDRHLLARQAALPARQLERQKFRRRAALHPRPHPDRKADDFKVNPDGTSITATIHAGNFAGHWLSSTDLVIRIELRADTLESTITAKNVGHEAEPLAIGWHPYFTIPSGARQQLRLHIPATQHVEANNLDDVFPTGALTPVKGTAYDFTAPEGRAIGDTFYDDSFAGLVRDHGQVSVDLIDRAARYGLHIQGLSPEIKTVQFYAPKDKPFVALEEQYNFGDPFSSVWKGMDTGMVTLAPGQSTTWRVQLQLFSLANSFKVG